MSCEVSLPQTSQAKRGDERRLYWQASEQSIKRVMDRWKYARKGLLARSISVSTSPVVWPDCSLWIMTSQIRPYAHLLLRFVIFFFLLAFASCLTPMILGQHLSLKVFYFYFFKTASKRCKRAYRALLMILSETKPARSLDTSSLFPGLFPAIRINKTQQLLCRMYPTSPIMLFLPVSQEYPHIIKKRFCVPWMRCPINRVDPKERFHCT